jgi:hypothetical protein
MKKIFLSTDIPNGDKTASSKAKLDVKSILESEGFETLYFPKLSTIKEIRRFWKDLSAQLTPGSLIFIEFPIWHRRRLLILRLILKIKRIKLYGIVHDISSLRFVEESTSRDMVALRNFDGLVSHNKNMTAWLREKGAKNKIVNLEVFDYLLDKPRNFHEIQPAEPIRLFYAGNLAYNKATYIYDKKLHNLNNVELCVYGQHFEPERMNGSPVVFKGVFNPSEPDLNEKYHFGLIWEGTSLETCDGTLGNYIRYNNPHKFSLYLAIGLPVIVWKEAAVAKFVEKYKIGFTITDFKDMESLTTKITGAQYAEYVRNIEELADKVRNGYFLKKAVAELINQ